MEKRNYKIQYLDNGRFQIQQNINGKFGKAQTLDLGHEYLKDKPFEEVIDSIKETLNSMSPEELEKFVGESRAKQDEKTDGQQDDEVLETEPISLDQFVNRKTLVRGLVILGVAITGIGAVMISQDYGADILKTKNDSKINIISQKIIDLENGRTKELTLQKDLRIQREQERKKREEVEKYYDELINNSKSRVVAIDKDVAFYKEQSVVLSSQIDVLTGMIIQGHDPTGLSVFARK